MDKHLIRTRFSRSLSSYNDSAYAQRHIAGRLCDMTAGQCKGKTNAGKVLEIGCGTGILTRLFITRFHPSELTLVDICPDVAAMFRDIECRFIAGDAEYCDLPSGQDMIISCSVIQWFEDQKAFLSRCSGLLNDKGMLAISTFGQDNLMQIKALTGTGLEYTELERFREAVTCSGFRILALEEEHINLQFNTPEEILHHLRNTGVTGISRSSWTKGSLRKFASSYMERYRLPDGTVPLTYHPIYLIAEKS